MSDEKKYTEREVIKREREAFCAGVYTTHNDQRDSRNAKADSGVYEWHALYDRPHLNIEKAEKFAAERYPLPKVVRPRVLKDSEGTQWRVNSDGRLEFRTIDDWHVMLAESGHGLYGTALKPNGNRCRLWADLFENPTETVPDDA